MSSLFKYKMQSIRLLPHAFNVISISYLILYLIISWVFSRYLPARTPAWLGIINCIAVMTACFSAEKVEDEMIRNIRVKTVVIVGCLFLLVSLIKFICMIASGPTLLSDIFVILEDAMVWALLYLAIFKIRLFLE
ncbi:MAG: hypothetical protein IJ795_07795 [Bacteroidales bacterium]|nr:hypothetical protein [Bacteroidales bacterium]